MTKHQQVDSINHMLDVMQIDVKKNPIKITFGGSLLAGSGVGASAAHCVSLARALNEEFDMDLSHEILIYLCNKALELGALGAKVTGGGRGGYMNALTPGKELQEKVASAMEKEGYKVIRAAVGGVCREYLIFVEGWVDPPGRTTSSIGLNPTFHKSDFSFRHQLRSPPRIPTHRVFNPE
jgi:mevalonate kinase